MSSFSCARRADFRFGASPAGFVAAILQRNSKLERKRKNAYG
jgi:hypothetical protein